MAGLRLAEHRYFEAHGARTMRDFTGSSFVDFLRVFGFGLGFILAPRYENLSFLCHRSLIYR
jgi:hypothetical protein